MTIEPKITEIAERIFAMRELCEFTVEEMAEAIQISPAEYEDYESGSRDLSLTFLHKCAKKFGIDLIELLTGENPHLSGFTIVRKGNGLPIVRRDGFNYYHLAANFKNKMAEPFVVIAPYNESSLSEPVVTSTHDGQEFNLILEGTLKFVYDGHTSYLNAGDSVYYDSGKKHGMIAVSETGCKFLTVVIKDSE